MLPRSLKYPIYKLDKLPNIVCDYFEAENSFSGKKSKAYTGTIIRRPGTGSRGIMFHYGLFYGFVENGIPYVLHNDQYGVECLSFEDYLNGEKFEIVEQLNDNDSSQLIIDRAIQRKNRMFHLKLNNCEHFVNYSVYETLYSQQTEYTNIAENILMFGLGLPVYLSGDETLITKFEKFKKNIVKPVKVRHTITNTTKKGE